VNANSSAQTVLLVEDEVLIRLHIAKYLRECGYQVFEAISADEAYSWELDHLLIIAKRVQAKQICW
jgi:DNA-binding response OmpR family regulator